MADDINLYNGFEDRPAVDGFNPYDGFDHRDELEPGPAPPIRAEPPRIHFDHPHAYAAPDPVRYEAPAAVNNGIIFDPVPDRRGLMRMPRGLIRRAHPGPHMAPFPGWGYDSDDDYYSEDDSEYPYYMSDDENASYRYPFPYPYHNHHRGGQRRQRHQHIHLPPGLTLPPGMTNNVVVRRPAAAAAAPRNYGYRRLHYQGGQERRGRRRTNHHAAHCHPQPNRAHCETARSPQRNIFSRCGRFLFGEPGRCLCGRGCSGRGGGCCGDDERSRSRSPTRHREEEYWGPGNQQNWAYGPTDNRSANWRDTPWSSGAKGMTSNLAPGAVIEEVEEGGTLPTTAAIADRGRTHNHYHIGTDGRRSSGRGGTDDRNILGLVDRERDRELKRQALDQEMKYLDHHKRHDREWAEREAVWKRDQQILKLLDKDREREGRGANRITGVLKGELGREGRGADRVTRLLKEELRREGRGADRVTRVLKDELGREGRGAGRITRVLKDELGRSRLVTPKSRKSVKKLKANNGPVDSQDGGLKSEMEALRKDFQRLLRSSSTPSSVAEGSKAKGDKSVGGSVASRGRQKSLPVPEIQFDSRVVVDIETEDSESDEEQNEEDEEDEEDDGDEEDEEDDSTA